MPAQTTERIEVNVKDLEALLERVKGAVEAKDYELLEKLVASLAYLTDLIENKETTIGRLRKILFGSKSEKTRDVLKDGESKDEGEATGKRDDKGSGEATGGEDKDEPEGSGEGKEAKEKPKGHGRNGADAYDGAERVDIEHESLKAGDPCPETGCKGKLSRLAKPGVMVRVRGQAPLAALIWALEKLRCNLCGKVFTAKAPEGLGEEKYDESARAMVALLRYGQGLPFNRLEKLEENLGIPLPASTQWDMAESTAERIKPALSELIRQAAQGEVLHNDDTTMTILSLLERGEKRERGPPEGTEKKGSKERTGVFTSGVVSIAGGRRVALFFTGRKHAGENLSRVLKERAAELSPPIQMCDALSRNVPAEAESIVANCLAHGRRRFVEVCESFPAESRIVLESLRTVYRNDAIARKRGYGPSERLRLHEAESGPVMKKLKEWLESQFSEKKVEPNSGLGEAIEYMLEHWEKLTVFLREPGAPLDNSICEQALKKSIIHRKNSLFFKTENGADVGDLFMSLIHTCELQGENAFEYLVALQKHAKDLETQPAAWMPWNYRERLRALELS